MPPRPGPLASAAAAHVLTHACHPSHHPSLQVTDKWLATLNLRWSRERGWGALPAPTRTLPLPFTSTPLTSAYNQVQPKNVTFATPLRLRRAVITSLITGAAGSAQRSSRCGRGGRAAPPARARGRTLTPGRCC